MSKPISTNYTYLYNNHKHQTMPYKNNSEALEKTLTSVTGFAWSNCTQSGQFWLFWSNIILR